MPELKFSRSVAYSPEQMLALVSDLETYPHFVPNCSAMAVSNREGGQCDALMHISFGPVSQSYTSRVNVDEAALSVHSRALDGPFSYLDSKWDFIPEGQGTRIKLRIDFKISNPLIGALAEPAFAAKQGEILDAFMAEAQRRYG